MGLQYNEIGLRIREIRRTRNITQEKAAEKSHISASFFGHVERGSRKASLETLANIALVLDTSTDYLLFGSVREKADDIPHLTALAKDMLDRIGEIYTQTCTQDIAHDKN